MDYDEDKVDAITLALMYLVRCDDRFCARAWKGFDWSTMNRLHAKGLIGDPKGQARSVLLTERGARLSEELFETHFGRRKPGSDAEGGTA